jgi:hypothetical protein
MTRRYALIGARSGTALTHNGKMIVHTDRAEMEFLFPSGCKVVEIGPATPESDTVTLQQYPDTCHIVFPINRDDFGPVDLTQMGALAS